MEAEGQRTSSNPSAVLAALLSKRSKLHEDLRNLEKQSEGILETASLTPWDRGKVYDMETIYLQDPSQCGNVLKGFEGFLSSSKSTSFLKRSRKFQPEDRLFSLSSVTSPAAEEQALGRDAGGMSANGQGRQRKGRGGPRDAKRMRHSSEPDYDYEDDPDLM